jgi:serine protease Do
VVGNSYMADAGGQGPQSPGHMFVPIDLLKPILSDVLRDGPAERAGLRADDIVLAVAEEVRTLADFYTKLWSRGAAGVEVPLKVLRGRRCAN